MRHDHVLPFCRSCWRLGPDTDVEGFDSLFFLFFYLVCLASPCQYACHVPSVSCFHFGKTEYMSRKPPRGPRCSRPVKLCQGNHDIPRGYHRLFVPMFRSLFRFHSPLTLGIVFTDRPIRLLKATNMYTTPDRLCHVVRIRRGWCERPIYSRLIADGL